MDEVARIPMVRRFEGKKFLWDGEEYEDGERASALEQEYREKGFEVQRVSAGAKALLYTRRLVSATEGS